jgi:Ca-activated chloride channel family protein
MRLKSKEPVAQDLETIVVDSELTTILMTATDNRGGFITTLKPEDIRVLEDKVPQRIEVFERETERPLSLALVFDVSGSQARSLPYQKVAARIFLNSIVRPGQDKVAVISFSNETMLQQNFVSELAPVENAIDRLQIGDGTSLYDTIFLTCLKVFKNTAPDARRAIILLTDAGDTTSRLQAKDAVNGAVYANTIVYGIGIGNGVSEMSLNYLAHHTGGRSFLPRTALELQWAFKQIEQELRSQYLIAYRSTNKAHDGKRRSLSVEVVNEDVAKEKVKLAYRDHYFVRNRDGANRELKKKN